jgi:hypothetical protein
MGGGKGKSSPPPQIDPGKSMGEFYFGKGFSNYQGVTDPRLQELFLGAEATYRPEYTALELADIGVMARGLGEREVADPRYTQAQDRISGLQAELAKTPDTISETRKTGLHGRNRSRTETVSVPNPKRAELEREIASQQELIAGLSPTKMQSATPGLFDLLEEQSRRAGVLQREELQLQRESDVGALREFAPQVVEAYRAADPYSTGLADMASRQAETLYAEGEGELSPERRRMAEQAARMGSLARGRIGDESSIAAELLGREQFRSGLRAEARQAGGQAFGMQRQMAGDIGSVLLGRPSAAIGLGGQMLGQAQAGAAGPMGPQLFDPNVGINMALQQRGQDVTFQGMQAQAKAAGQAGIMGAAGSIAGAAIMACWVAREVYGIDNPKWLQFREWMLTIPQVGSASYTLSSVKGLRPSFQTNHVLNQSSASGWIQGLNNYGISNRNTN